VSNNGVGAHITAAAPRWTAVRSVVDACRAGSAANAIWLCNTCGRLVDNDASTYTVGELVKWKVDAIDRAQKALASGGRSTAEGLFAAQLELQKQALAQQRENLDAQMREQQRSKFSEMYGRFLEEAHHDRASSTAMSGQAGSPALRRLVCERCTAAEDRGQRSNELLGSERTVCG